MAALDGGVDGLSAYRSIIEALPGLLAPGGLAAMEVGEGQARQVYDMAEQGGLTRFAALGLEVHDLAGIEKSTNRNESISLKAIQHRVGHANRCSSISLISSRVLQSMHLLAVGRASRRRMPISMPQDLQKPNSSSSINCKVFSIFLINLRSRSRVRDGASRGAS